MALSWLNALRTKRAQHLAQLERACLAATVQFEYVDRPPGWVFDAMTYTLIPPSGYELDPQLVARIRSFCPDYVPMWIRATFLTPYDDAGSTSETFTRHAIARAVRDLQLDAHVFQGLEVPAGYSGPWPNYLERIVEGAPDPRASDLPGAYVPIDAAYVERMRQEYTRFSNLSPRAYAREVLGIKHVGKGKVETIQSMSQARRLASRLDLQKRFTRELSKHLHNISELELRDFLLGSRPTSPRPYSFLGGVPAEGDKP